MQKWKMDEQRSDFALHEMAAETGGNQMIQLPDAPWIRETEMTGYCRSGWWNTPPEPEDEETEVDED